jgi:hypothetical protein
MISYKLQTTFHWDIENSRVNHQISSKDQKVKVMTTANAGRTVHILLAQLIY